MSWRLDSTAGAAIWDTEVPSSQDLLCRDEELSWLMNHGRKHWQLINGRIADKGDPTALEGTYGGLQAYPPVAAQTGASMTTGTATPGVCLWSDAVYSPILANAVMAPSAYKLYASGTIQTSVTGGTLTLLPSIGTGLVNAAPTTNQPLGVSGAATLATSALTSLWRLEGDLTIRSVGAAGTAWFMGVLHYGNIAAPVTSAATIDLILGGTLATVDFTGVTANYPGGLQTSGWNAGSGTLTVVTNSVHFISWN